MELDLIGMEAFDLWYWIRQKSNNVWKTNEFINKH